MDSVHYQSFRVGDDDQKGITFNFYFTNKCISGVTRNGKFYGSDLNYLMISQIYLGCPKYIQLCFSSLREKYPYSEFLRSVFYSIRIEYGVIQIYVSLCIQSKCVKIRTRKTPNMDTFHAVIIGEISSYKKRKLVSFQSHFRPILLYLQRPPVAKLAKSLLFVARH